MRCLEPTDCDTIYIYRDGVNQRGQKVALCPCGNLCIRSRNKTWPARVGNWLKAHVARSSNEKNPEPSLWTCRFCEGEKGKRRFPRFYCPLLRSRFLFCFVRFILPCRDRQNFDPSAPFDPPEKSQHIGTQSSGSLSRPRPSEMVARTTHPHSSNPIEFIAPH